MIENRTVERITVEPGKLNGQPAIRGLRVTVAHIVRLVAAGWTLTQIQDDSPSSRPKTFTRRSCTRPVPRKW